MTEHTPETPQETPQEFGPITEATTPIVTPVPQPDAPPLDTPPDVPESAAERVRRRIRQGRGGGAASEPSAGESTPLRPANGGREPPPKPRPGSLVRPLTEFYTAIGLMLAPVDPVCSVAFMDNAEACARSLENLARENETVRRVIVAMTQTSAWGGAIIAHLPILLIIIVHHGPRDIADRAAPMAMMMNPRAMEAAAEAARKAHEAAEGDAA